MLSAAASLALLLASQSLARPAGDSQSYIRVQRDARGNPLALETAIVRFVPQGNDRSGLQVDLVGAIHVGEKSYYEALNKRFDGYDVVLYELVAPDGTHIPKGGGAKDRNALSAIQNSITELLDLEYQLDGVDYTKKNFVHADLSPEQFAKSMADKGESLWSIFMRLMAAGMAQQAANPDKNSDVDIMMALFDRDRSLKLKRILAEQFADVETFMAAFNGPEGSTLITERNKAALKVLKDQIAAGRKKIAIFYGGGHMADMHQRLVGDFQLKPADTQWLEAWNLRDKKK